MSSITNRHYLESLTRRGRLLGTGITRKGYSSMGTGRQPTIRLRRLAGELTRLRVDSGYSREEVAGRLGVAFSTIYRIETGLTRPRAKTLRDLLELYGADPGHRAALADLARDAGDRGWWHAFGDVLPGPRGARIGGRVGAQLRIGGHPRSSPDRRLRAGRHQRRSRGDPEGHRPPGRPAARTAAQARPARLRDVGGSRRGRGLAPRRRPAGDGPPAPSPARTGQPSQHHDPGALCVVAPISAWAVRSAS